MFSGPDELEACEGSSCAHLVWAGGSISTCTLTEGLWERHRIVASMHQTGPPPDDVCLDG